MTSPVALSAAATTTRMDPRHASRTVEPVTDLDLALVSTYPPTLCGIASYAARLRRAMPEHLEEGRDPAVVRIVDDLDGDDAPSEVVASLRSDDPRSIRRAGRILSEYDAVVLQHEYGIFGPRSGISVLDLAERVESPLIVTLHTVTPHPTGRERYVLRSLIDRADRVVLLSNSAGEILHQTYDVDPAVTAVIHHGTDPVDHSPGPQASHAIDIDGDPVLLNWGLVGPGKGLEWAIDAVAILRLEFPDVVLVIAGATHPKVLAHDGDAYRRSLELRALREGVAGHVVMIDEYLPRATLHDLLRQTSAVVLPYESTEQTSSGVLVEAVTAGVPVVATDFPHSVEIARAGAGVAVPHRDPVAIAAAVRHLVSDPQAATRMRERQKHLSAAMHWDTVGARYVELAGSVVAAGRN